MHQQSGRGTGLTTQMIRDLGAGHSIVIVHNSGMLRHVVDIANRLNAEDNGDRGVHVVAVRSVEDVQRLRGYSRPVVVDHAFWGLAEHEDVRTAVRELVEEAGHLGTGRLE